MYFVKPVYPDDYMMYVIFVLLIVVALAIPISIIKTMIDAGQGKEYKRKNPLFQFYCKKFGHSLPASQTSYCHRDVLVPMLCIFALLASAVIIGSPYIATVNCAFAILIPKLFSLGSKCVAVQFCINMLMIEIIPVLFLWLYSTALVRHI